MNHRTLVFFALLNLCFFPFFSNANDSVPKICQFYALPIGKETSAVTQPLGSKDPFPLPEGSRLLYEFDVNSIANPSKDPFYNTCGGVFTRSQIKRGRDSHHLPIACEEFEVYLSNQILQGILPAPCRLFDGTKMRSQIQTDSIPGCMQMYKSLSFNWKRPIALLGRDVIASTFPLNDEEKKIVTPVCTSPPQTTDSNFSALAQETSRPNSPSKIIEIRTQCPEIGETKKCKQGARVKKSRVCASLPKLANGLVKMNLNCNGKWLANHCPPVWSLVFLYVESIYWA